MIAGYELISISRRYLALVRDALQMDVAMVSEIVDTGQLVHALEGSGDDFGLTEGEVAPANHLAHASAHLAAPIVLSGDRLFGWISTFSSSPRPDLGAGYERLLQSLATALSEELAVLQARNDSRRTRREQIQQVIAGSGLNMVAQPIVDLVAYQKQIGRSDASGKDDAVSPEWRKGAALRRSVVGVEALSRFEHPPRRPDQWFADASTLGVGLDLELAAITQALDFIDVLDESLYVSVNASPALAMTDDLTTTLSTVDTSRVVLEITEHAHVTTYDELHARMGDLRAAGLRLAVDDAGAGYSSFRHILQLQPNIIKLDRDMIHNIAGDRARRALVAALVGFAGDLSAHVVAEGLETEDEMQCLMDLGVTYGQGYFIARPASLDTLGIDSAERGSVSEGGRGKR